MNPPGERVAPRAHTGRQGKEPHACQASARGARPARCKSTTRRPTARSANVLRQGEQVRVLSPGALVDAVRARLRAASALYDAGSEST